MPVNEKLRQRILNCQVHQSGMAYTASYMADNLKVPPRAVGAVLGHLARRGKISRLEETNPRGQPLFCKLKSNWLHQVWRQHSNDEMGVADYPHGRGI